MITVSVIVLLTYLMPASIVIHHSILQHPSHGKTLNLRSEGLELRGGLRQSLLALILGEQVAEGPLALSVLVVVPVGKHLMDSPDGPVPLRVLAGSCSLSALWHPAGL